VHFHEIGLETVEGGKLKTLARDANTVDPEAVTEISDLEELRTVWSDIFV
jgi:pyrimidine and pyridine-specific 5'-nucleotidase